MLTNVWLVSYLILWAVVLLQVFFLWALIRQVGMLSILLTKGDRTQSTMILERGMPVPNFEATDPINHTRSSLEAHLGTLTVVTFVSSSCPACHQLVEQVGKYAHQFQDGQRLILVDVDGDASDLLSNHNLSCAVLVSPDEHGSVIARTYPMPWAMVIDKDRKVQAIRQVQAWLDIVRLGEESSNDH